MAESRAAAWAFAVAAALALAAGLGGIWAGWTWALWGWPALLLLCGVPALVLLLRRTGRAQAEARRAGLEQWRSRLATECGLLDRRLADAGAREAERRALAELRARLEAAELTAAALQHVQLALEGLRAARAA